MRDSIVKAALYIINCFIIFLITLFVVLAPGLLHGQQPQVSQPNPQPLQGINSKWTNGVGAGYAPLCNPVNCSSTLSLNVTAGTCFDSSMVRHAWAGSASSGYFTMAASQTNYVYLSTSACAILSNTTGYPSTGAIPLFQVVTSGSTITGITDDRTWFGGAGGSGGGGGGTGCSSTGPTQVGTPAGGANSLTLTIACSGSTVILFQNAGSAATNPLTITAVGAACPSSWSLVVSNVANANVGWMYKGTSLGTGSCAISTNVNTSSWYFLLAAEWVNLGGVDQANSAYSNGTSAITTTLPLLSDSNEVVVSAIGQHLGGWAADPSGGGPVVQVFSTGASSIGWYKSTSASPQNSIYWGITCCGAAWWNDNLILNASFLTPQSLAIFYQQDQVDGTTQIQEPINDFVSGTGMSCSGADDPANKRTKITCGLSVPVTVPNGGTGNTTAAAHSIPLNQGTSAQTNATLADDQDLIGRTSADPVATTIPDCQDTGGNHLNYTQSTHAYSCGSTTGGSGNFVNLCSLVTLTNATCSGNTITFSAVSSFTISSIPGSYLSLKLILEGYAASGDSQAKFVYNSDTTAAHYTCERVGGFNGNNSAFGSCAGVGVSGGITPMELGNNSSNLGSAEITIPFYAGSRTKNTIGINGETQDNLAQITQGLWNQTSAITSITISANGGANITGSLLLYGLN